MTRLGTSRNLTNFTTWPHHQYQYQRGRGSRLCNIDLDLGVAKSLIHTGVKREHLRSLVSIKPTHAICLVFECNFFLLQAPCAACCMLHAACRAESLTLPTYPRGSGGCGLSPACRVLERGTGCLDPDDGQFPLHSNIALSPYRNAAIGLFFKTLPAPSTVWHICHGAIGA